MDARATATAGWASTQCLSGCAANFPERICKDRRLSGDLEGLERWDKPTTLNGKGWYYEY